VGSFPRFHEDKGREISVNISRSYRLTHPQNRSTELTTKSPPKRGLSNLNDSKSVALLYSFSPYNVLSENDPVGRRTTECLSGQTKRGR